MSQPATDKEPHKDRSDGMRRGPLGDALPGPDSGDSQTEGGQPQEKVEDRPNVSTVKPEDYPEQQ